MRKLFIVLVAGIAVMGLSGCGKNVEETKTAVDAYNAQAETINEKIDAFNASVEEAAVANEGLQSVLEEAQSALTRGDVVLDESAAAQLEACVGQAEEALQEVPQALESYPLFTVDESASSKELKELKAEAEAGVESLGAVEVAEAVSLPDYTETIAGVQSALAAYEESAAQGAIVNAPAPEYVLERLGKVAAIAETAQAEAENDVAKLVGTEGGPTAILYFKGSDLDPAQIFVEGKCETLLQAGILLGGSVEIYGTQEAALERDAYLASYDAGLITAGGHQVVGTLVIRTSPAYGQEAREALVGQVVEALLA